MSEAEATTETTETEATTQAEPGTSGQPEDIAPAKPKGKAKPHGKPIKDAPAPAGKPKGKAKESAPAEPKIAPVRINNITIDDSIQPRAGKLSEDHITEIQEAYKTKRSVPPVVVYKTAAGDMILSQGFHRVEAARRNGNGFVLTEIREGERIDATIDALSSNQGHGLKRTSADKRRAVMEMLKVCPKWTDRRIADQLGVDSGTVGNVRAELTTTDATASPDEREGKRGQKVKVKPKAEKKAKQDTAEAAEQKPETDTCPEATATAPLEETSAPPPVVATDDFGLPIPAELLPAFEVRAQFEELTGLLKHAKAIVTQIGNHAGGALLLKRLQWIRSDNKDGGRWSLGDLENASIAVEEATPSIADCPYKYAEGDQEHGKDCPLCHGTEFVGNLKHRQVPTELVEKMKAARS